jgi:hypothetical protein
VSTDPQGAAFGLKHPRIPARCIISYKGPRAILCHPAQTVFQLARDMGKGLDSCVKCKNEFLYGVNHLVSVNKLLT